MKAILKNTLLTLAVLSVAAFFTSCRNEDNDNTVSATLQIHFDVEEGSPLPETVMVRFTNHAEGINTDVLAYGDFRVTVDGLIPGLFTIMATAEILDGTTVWRYAGSLANVSITERYTDLGTLSIAPMAAPGLVFSEIFFSGSQREDGPGTWFRHQFYEIHNNSAHTIYLDGLALAIVDPNMLTHMPRDWPAEYEGVYIFSSDAIWVFPGSGNEFPLRSGESAIVAQNAMDHNPMVSFNLLSAEFETYVAGDNHPIDNPAISMNLAFTNGTFGWQWLTPVAGTSYVLFNPSVAIGPENTSIPGGGFTTPFHKIRIADVIDAVEAVADITQAKRLPMELDAGRIHAGPAFGGRSISRRVNYTRPDGTVVFLDTNNSTYDFVSNDAPMIRRHGATRPAWATWGN